MDRNFCSNKIKQCLCKFADGQFIAALKVIYSSGFSPYNGDTMKALEAKHSHKQHPSMQSILYSDAPIVSKIDCVLSYIKSFPKVSLYGRDNLRAQRILDALSGDGSNVATDFFGAITVVVRGKVAVEVSGICCVCSSYAALKTRQRNPTCRSGNYMEAFGF